MSRKESDMIEQLSARVHANTLTHTHTELLGNVKMQVLFDRFGWVLRAHIFHSAQGTPRWH